jgi:hypothetical protein
MRPFEVEGRIVLAENLRTARWNVRQADGSPGRSTRNGTYSPAFCEPKAWNQKGWLRLRSPGPSPKNLDGSPLKRT